MAVAVPATELRQLTRMIRVMFPHERFPDGPYERSAQKILDSGEEDARLKAQLVQGLRDLDGQAGGEFTALDDVAALELLKGIERSEFFEAVRAAVITSLYDDPEVWALLGYEGDATKNGGYLETFNDLDWLPEPRIEEAE